MREEFPVTAIFFIALILKYRVSAHLSERQSHHLKNIRSVIPSGFEEKMTLTEHQKACDYHIDLLKTNRVFNIISLIIILCWTMGGGLHHLYNLCTTFNFSTYTTSIIFLGLVTFISSLLQLPQDIYHTFVIEEKYGFNKMTPALFIKDLVKSFLLALILGLPFAMIVLSFIERMENSWWFFAFLFTAFFQILLIWLYPVVIAPLFNKFFPLDEGELKNRLQTLLEKTGLKSKGLYVMDASKRSAHGNAYFTGFGRNKRVVLFDTLLLNLKPEEVEAVLAHEIGHFKKKHILKNMFLGLGMSFLFFLVLGILLKFDLFFKGHGVLTVGPATGLALLALVFSSYTFMLTPLFSSFSRKMEFEADQYAKTIMNSGKELSDALFNTYKENSSPVSSDPSYAKFYYSHPTLLERIEKLK